MSFLPSTLTPSPWFLDLERALVTYTPNQTRSNEVIEWFSGRDDHAAMIADLRAFFDEPTIDTARAACTTYFRLHQEGDVESLRMFTATFADKRIVAALVDSILADDDAIESIATRSYPHPIGFDKLVLHHDRETGWKLRLHIYWRGNNRAETERLHLHRFEMASAIVSGELTNHSWAVTDFENSTGLIPGISLAPPGQGGSEQRTMEAYSGYRRDDQGQLRKSHLGTCELERLESHTFVSGQSYSQVLTNAHYVETLSLIHI